MSLLLPFIALFALVAARKEVVPNFQQNDERMPIPRLEHAIPPQRIYGGLPRPRYVQHDVIPDLQPSYHPISPPTRQHAILSHPIYGGLPRPGYDPSIRPVVLRPIYVNRRPTAGAVILPHQETKPPVVLKPVYGNIPPPSSRPVVLKPIYVKRGPRPPAIIIPHQETKPPVVLKPVYVHPRTVARMIPYRPRFLPFPYPYRPYAVRRPKYINGPFGHGTYRWSRHPYLPGSITSFEASKPLIVRPQPGVRTITRQKGPVYLVQTKVSAPVFIMPHHGSTMAEDVQTLGMKPRRMRRQRRPPVAILPTETYRVRPRIRVPSAKTLLPRELSQLPQVQV